MFQFPFILLLIRDCYSNNSNNTNTSNNITTTKLIFYCTLEFDVKIVRASLTLTEGRMLPAYLELTNRHRETIARYENEGSLTIIYR